MDRVTGAAQGQTVPAPEGQADAPTRQRVPTAHLMDLLQVMAVRQQKYERAMAGVLGVDRTSLEVLYQLISQGPSTPTQLARASGLTTAATAQVLKRLDAGGHLQRHRHASDRRKVVVTASERTTERAQELIDPFLHAVTALLDGAAPGDVERIAWFLDSISGVYARTEPLQPLRPEPLGG